MPCSPYKFIQFLDKDEKSKASDANSITQKISSKRPEDKNKHSTFILEQLKIQF